MKKIFLNKSRCILLASLVLCLFFRFYRLGQVPPSPSLDEVSIGWNAYSISKIGVDEYGTKMPILLRAYDDWRPAMYVYFVIPFIFLFDLSVLAVRFPSALFSCFSVAIFFFFTKELLCKDKNRELLSAMAAFLLAISPWHIYISRLGHEVNLQFFFSLFGVFLFLKYINSKKTFFVYLSSVVFALSLYTYQSQKIFGPLIIIVMLILNFDFLKTRRKELILPILLGIIVSAPIIFLSFSKESRLRYSGTNIFTSQPRVIDLSAQRVLRDRQAKNFVGYFFDNKRVSFALMASKAYFTHLDPSWLFFNREEESHKAPNSGLMYFFQMPLLIFGFVEIIRRRFDKKTVALLVGWLLISPIPGAITTQAPHAMRTYIALVPWTIFSSMGLLGMAAKLRSYYSRAVFRIGMIFLIAISVLFFGHNYFDNLPYEQSDSFQYALSQAINYSAAIESNYQKIVFSNKDSLAQSYMFFLFFRKYDPALYQREGGTVSGGYDVSHKIGKYEFKRINWLENEVLFIGNVYDYIPEKEKLGVFKSLAGEEKIIAYYNE